MPENNPPRPAILFAHPTFDLAGTAGRIGLFPGVAQVRDREALIRRLPETEVLVVSSLWQDGMLDLAPRLRFIQTISVGFDFLDLGKVAARGVRVANVSGLNAMAVAQHAMAQILALSRRLPELILAQARGEWRKPSQRADEITDKEVVIIGTGSVGQKLSGLLGAFGCTVTGIRRQASPPVAGFSRILDREALDRLLPEADIVVIACPLTEETRHIIDAAALERMAPQAMLVNVGRGGCLDQAAAGAALAAGRIAAAALDVFEVEPLPQDSPLYRLPNVLITPHMAGDSAEYETNVLKLLDENLARLADPAGGPLRNELTA
ncbi:D-2-hydroxyacid dehydrogenase [Pseudogemmobacter sonorensis]|uniref:D-2-hydroxyacid dehydrogenase n=1 Tax=Pseudogemmobacter sonorensis TaxID=2989681 RepID=UPI0036C8A83E